MSYWLHPKENQNIIYEKRRNLGQAKKTNKIQKQTVITANNPLRNT